MSTPPPERAPQPDRSRAAWSLAGFALATEARSACCSVSVGHSADQLPYLRRSMGHCIEHNIDPHRVGLLFREFAEIIFVFSLPLPTIAQIGIVTKNDHQAAFVIEDTTIMHLLSSRIMIGLIGDASLLTSDAPINSRHLRLFFQIEDAMENRVVERQFH